jgi:hypothetical protein
MTKTSVTSKSVRFFTFIEYIWPGVRLLIEKVCAGKRQGGEGLKVMYRMEMIGTNYTIHQLGHGMLPGERYSYTWTKEP